MLKSGRMNPYSTIFYYQKKCLTLISMLNLLDWDQITNLPSLAVKERTAQTRIIESLLYDTITSPALKDAISEVKKNKISQKQEKIISELEKQISNRSKLPRYFTTKLSSEMAKSQEAWALARKNNDFEIFRPHLEKMIRIKRKYAIFLKQTSNPYDILLKEYEPGMTSEKLSKVFDYLKKELIPLLAKIKGSEIFKSQKEIIFSIPKNQQETLSKDIIKRINLPHHRVGFSSSLHPFTAFISPNDVRITTSYEDPIESFFSTVHEIGHCLYDLGLPQEYKDTFVYSESSFGMHESQSLFWEKMICSNRPFWEGYFSTYRKYLGVKIGIEDFYSNINIIKPTLVRSNADELTYCLHIILRFEIEKDLINGAISTAQVKDIWNAKCKELLGRKPRNDNEGILQDMHWASGDFGYFPSYAIGLIYASQIYSQLKKEINIDSLVKQQNFEPIKEWLLKKIYHKGKTRTSEEIIRNACKKAMDPKELIGYLKQKYSRIYGVSL